MGFEGKAMRIQGAHEPIVLSPNAGRHPGQHHQQGGFGSTRHQAQIPNLPDLEWGCGSGRLEKLVFLSRDSMASMQLSELCKSSKI